MKELKGKKIKILNTHGASWIKLGEVYEVTDVFEGNPVVNEISWSCSSDHYEIVQETHIPRYVKCIQEWGGIELVRVDEMFDTDYHSSFSRYSWEEIYTKKVANSDYHNVQAYFKKITEREFNGLPEGIINTYEIY